MNLIKTKISVFLAVMFASVGAFADYTTDIKPAFVAALTSVKDDVSLMAADATPTIIGVVALIMLIGIGIGMLRKAR